MFSLLPIPDIIGWSELPWNNLITSAATAAILVFYQIQALFYAHSILTLYIGDILPPSQNHIFYLKISMNNSLPKFQQIYNQS